MSLSMKNCLPQELSKGLGTNGRPAQTGNVGGAWHTSRYMHMILSPSIILHSICPLALMNEAQGNVQF